METVLVTGGTGLVSRHLCSKLQERGYDVAILSRTRKPEAAFRVYTWNPRTGSHIQPRQNPVIPCRR